VGYWDRYSGRQRAAGVGRLPTPMRRMERHQEAYHGMQARCPICGTWKYCKVIQDTWVGGAVQKLRLQCECGYAFTHDAKVHDHALERVSGRGRSGTYAPRGHRERRWHTPNRG
jgi:hypothetical protein